MLVYYTAPTQTPPAPMPQPSPVRQVRLGADLDALFDQALAARGIAASELLRSAVAQALNRDQNIAPMPASTNIGNEPDATSDTVRLTLRLSRTVVVAARHQAATKGMAVSRWIAALTRSKVSAIPVLTRAETTSLNRCAQALGAIGRNINQIAHTLNEILLQDSRIAAKTEGLELTVGVALDELYSKIEDTKTQITSLIEASRKSWEPR